MRTVLSEGCGCVKGRNHKQYSKNDDYYTPPWVFEALGLTFDTDVCAPIDGIPWIPAKKHYHLKIDGLLQPWEGLIWCNPPYSQPKPWIEKWLEHNNGIMLVQMSRSNGFIRLWEESDAIVALTSRIQFVHLSGEKRGIFMPVALFAKGEIATTALKKSNLGRVR